MEILTSEFDEALTGRTTGAIVDEISARRCSDDDHHGVEYAFSGEWVPLEPIMDVVTEKEGYAIKSAAHSGVGDVELVVFVAEDDTFVKGTVMA